MKHFKKFFSYLVALTMVLSLAAFTGVKVHAAEPTYTLTIKNSDGSDFADRYSFDIYQILKGDVTPTNATDKNGNKTEKTLSNITWGDSVTPTAKAAIGSDAKTFASTLTSERQAETMAKNLANNPTYLTAYNAPGSNVTGSRSADKKSYTFSNLPGGYYLVKDTTKNNGENDATSRYIVEVVGDTETVTKKSVPTTIKKVKENTKPVTDLDDDNIPGLNVGEKYNDVADYDIGDEVPFELIGTLPADYDKYETYYYQFTDTMDKSFTLNKKSVKAYYTNDDGKSWNSITLPENSVSTPDPDKDNSFTVTFNDLKTATSSLSASSKIKVEFNAILNEKANIGLPGNENKSYLTFSNDVNSTSKGKTAEDKVIVFTYEIETTKIDEATKNSSNPTALKDAQFQIKKGDNYLHQDDNGYITWGSADGAKTFTSGDDGKFVIKGLDSGTYTFHETKAPAGYNLPANDLTVELTASTANGQSWNGAPGDALTKLTLKGNAQDQEQEQDHEKHGTASQTITNDRGSNLPSTGGMGTTLLYVAGGILVACAAAYVIMSRKHSTNK